MGKVLELLSQHGPFAVIAGGLVYLFILVWKRYNEVFQRQHDAMVEETKMKAKLTEALEDVASSVGALGVQTGADTQACRAQTSEMLRKLEAHLRARELELAKEEARREVTGRSHVPNGGSHEGQRADGQARGPRAEAARGGHPQAQGQDVQDAAGHDLPHAQEARLALQVEAPAFHASNS